MDHDDDENVHSVRITARGVRAELEIDGQQWDPRALSGYTVTYREGEPPQVVLYSSDYVESVFEGLARVAVVDVPDPGPAAAVFLSAIDVAELERTALARSDLGTGPHSLTQAMLAQLGEWARGV